MRVAALLFVVQGALLAFSQGASADAMRLDQFGNVLCLASAEGHHAAAPAKDGKHADPMECCSLGCAMFAGVVSPPGATASAPMVHLSGEVAAFVSYADVLASVADSPRTTRGPPEAA